MEYNLSLAEFQSGKMFDSNRKFIHKTGNRFKLFPFVTQPNSVPVEDLSQLVGTFLCKIEGKKPDKIAVSELVAELKQETDIEAGQEQLFYETVEIKSRYVGKNGCFDNKFPDVSAYDGSANGKTIYKLNEASNLINTEYSNLIDALANLNQEIDPLEMKASAYVLSGHFENEDEFVPIKIIAISLISLTQQSIILFWEKKSKKKEIMIF